MTLTRCCAFSLPLEPPHPYSTAICINKTDTVSIPWTKCTRKKLSCKVHTPTCAFELIWWLWSLSLIENNQPSRLQAMIWKWWLELFGLMAWWCREYRTCQYILIICFDCANTAIGDWGIYWGFLTRMVYLCYIMLEIHHSGREPSIYYTRFGHHWMRYPQPMPLALSSLCYQPCSFKCLHTNQSCCWRVDVDSHHHLAILA